MKKKLPPLCAGLAAAALVFCSGLQAGAALPLDDLLTDTSKAVGVLEAEAELAGANGELDRANAEGGWRLMGNVGYARVRDVVDVGRTRDFDETQAKIGLNYPLLGSLQKQTRDVGTAEGKVRERGIRKEASGRLAQLEIEANYARYWQAQESLTIIDAYLASEQTIRQRLDLRRQNKMMVESDYVTLASGYEQSRSDRLKFQQQKDDALNRLKRLSGRELGAFEAMPVALAPLPQMPVDQILRNHPDLLALRAQQDTLKSQMDHSSMYGIDGSFDVAGAGIRDMTSKQNGGTVYTGFNISAPITLLKARNAEKRRLDSEIDVLRLRYQQKQDDLASDIRQANAQREMRLQDMSVAAQRSQASGAALREGYLRSKAVDKEGVESLSRKLQAYTTAALADVESRANAWLADVNARSNYYGDAIPRQKTAVTSGGGSIGAQLAKPILEFNQLLDGGKLSSAQPQGHNEFAAMEAAPARPVNTALHVSERLGTVRAEDDRAALIKTGGRTAPRKLKLTDALFRPAATPQLRQVSYPGPARAPSATTNAAGGGAPASGRDTAVYIWDSHDLIEHLQYTDKFWTGLNKLSISRLLVSLDAVQVTQVTAKPAQLKALISAARTRHVAVELLLGEPTWINPQDRPQLTSLIGKLAGFGFAGLNLDIEPDQIYKQPLSRQQFDDWMDTLKAASQASPWPTSLSVHPRYFRDAPYKDWNFAQRLRDAGVREAVLMIYSSDPNKVAQISKPITGSATDLKFRIAQSVEPGLSEKESHARRSPADFEKNMRQLQDLLAAQDNTDGIAVQAWADLMRMGYESQIR